ncbi:DUF3301 domain-containing protein [Methylonatrum kenyense]|uniref:DUF3301 domain-containing protein n=1 Tax=Methylonatrum kenyense TaxID=455253 RepID=UPI0020BFECB4|nr:DUF3301 domain-containing protein [Methylonatrum kenyense]MCK8515965.1 DUF3301 domain-containing protein [Methylonatrum kenyense]
MVIDNSIVIGALLLGLAALVWRSSMAALERAREAGKRACRQAGVQFLDDTVVLRGIRLQRSPGGVPAFERRYRFEFATRGDRRYRGTVTVFPRRPTRVEMEAYEPLGAERVD